MSFNSFWMQKNRLKKTLTSPRAFLYLFFIGFIVYSTALNGDFLWDDEYQIIFTPDTYNWQNIPSLFLKGQLGIYYKPAFFSYLTILHSAFGLNSFVFHLVQVLIHVVNSFLVFLIFKKFLSSSISLVLATIFIVHPMNVEAITYISAAGDPVSFMFGITAFYIMSRRKVGRLFPIAIILMTVSLFAKESGALIVFIIVLYRSFFIKNSYIKSILFALIPTLIYCFMRFVVAQTFFVKLNFIPISLAPLHERLLTIPKIIFTYLYTFFFPKDLLVAQHWVVREPSLEFFLPLLIVIVFFSAMVLSIWSVGRTRKKLKLPLLFFGLWFVTCLGLYFQIFPLDMTVADRWFYLPMVGLLGFIGILIENFKTKKRRVLVLLSIVIFIITILLSMRTINRNTNWRNAFVLFGHDLRYNQNSFDIHLNYAYQLAKRGLVKEALVHAEKSTRLAPTFTATWATAGNIYLRNKEYDKAINYSKKAVEIYPENYAAYYVIVQSYLYLKDYSNVKQWLGRALEIFPDDVYMILFLAISEHELGNKQKALSLTKSAISISPIPFGTYMIERIVRNQTIMYEKYLIYN